MSEKETQEENPLSSDVVEVEWEEVQQLVRVRAALLETDSQLSRLLINYEKQKFKLLSRAEELEDAMYQLGAELKDSKKIDQSLTYELKLPESEGEKAYFLKKES